MASVLLVVLRLVQGLSVGGELIGSISFVTESAPPDRRGFAGSWSLFSASGGIMLGSAVATILHGILSDTALHSWGWRVPFICGIIIGVVGLWMRRGLVETGEFERVKKAGEIDRNPVATALKSSPGTILHVASLVVLMGGGFYILFVWWPTYLTKIVQPSIPHALTVNTIAMLFLMALTPVGGWLSDKVGRRPVLVIAIAGILVSAYPLIYLTDHGSFFSALGAQMIFALFMSGASGPIPSTMVELFPTRTRFSGVAVGYNVSLAIFGGTSPLVATWLISKTGDIAAPAYYLMALAVVNLIAAFMIKHTHGGMLD
jgi:MHS family proline/betaine transporter-like MFS transporter